MITNLAFTIISFFSYPVSGNYQQNDLIDWSEKKLTFDDFKGKGKISKKPEGEFSSKISWTILEESGKTPVYKIYNKMDRSQSWLSIKHNELLKEYQFLWNLSELYTRKIRKDIEKLNQNKVTDKVIYKGAITKQVQNFYKQRAKYVGVVQNQPDLFKIIDKQYNDSLLIYNKYK